MKRIIAPCVAGLLTATGTNASEISTITVPVSLSVDGLQQFVNQQVKNPIHKTSESKRCAEAQQACTKIPEFRGFKVYSRMECVTVVPAIDCTIDQSINREGSVVLSNEAGRLRITGNIVGSATVRGRGAIGEHIRETADGRALVTIDTLPRISSDWSLELPFEHRIDWTEPPQAMLLNLFPLTFETDANNAINSAVDQFKTNTLQGALDNLNIKEKMTVLWQLSQKPIALAVSENENLFLHFNPQEIALNPLQISSQSIESTISLSGNLQVSDQSAWPFAGEATALPQLGAASAKPGISINVPLKIETETLNRYLRADLPQNIELPSALVSAVMVEDIGLEVTDGKLKLNVTGTFALPGGKSLQRTIHLSGSPALHQESQMIQIADPTLSIETRNPIEKLLNPIFNTSPLKKFIETKAQFSLAEEIKSAESKLERLLNQQITKDIRISGSVDLSLVSISLDNGLNAELIAEGSAGLSGFTFD